MEERDAVIVGARCAGSTLAIALADRGWDVLLVDRATFPSDTVSTHFMYPNTVARMEQLGILDTLLGSHEVPFLANRTIGLGHRIEGLYTPIEGFDRGMGPRRVALDKAIADTAVAKPRVESRFGARVAELIGSGTEDDPVAGVVLDNGDRVKARWVFGADGRGSTVAGQLGIEKERPQQGEISFLFGYWAGIPNDGFGTLDIKFDHILSRWAGEDGTHLLVVGGDAEMTQGSKEERMRRYLGGLRLFPEALPHDELDRAEMISDLVVAPESLMRGFFRKPAGAGWALLGDACHFKHPGTAQGICDAFEQAIYIAEHLSGADPGLGAYESWRDARAAEHYDWSFSWGRFPRPESENLFRGWATEQDAGQDLRDSFSRQVEPSQVMSKERLARWFSDAPARSA
jgi:2-polyprenyl-6-methoxyphenol hydroxylase-like FAD-dependent oxidoreductase